MANLALPGNPRYQPKALQSIWGYDLLYTGVCLVDVATLEVLGDIKIIPAEEMKHLTPAAVEAMLAITTTDVDIIERTITHHDIRAWIRKVQELGILGPLGRWLHLPNTSYDPISTGVILQFIRAHREVIRPLAVRLVTIFAECVREYAHTVQIGRTHGQHALPVTVGFWFATILNRLIFNLKEADRFCDNLVGKLSGAVGTHSAQIGLGISERCGKTTFEERVLGKLGVRPAPISTQILPPEPLVYYLHSICMLSASLAQFGRDGRNLMRTEINELREPFEKEAVGSSTMASKRNPINFEQSEGMWKKNIGEYVKVLLTLISEHQRDLTDSSVLRDFPIIVVNTVTQMETFLKQTRDKATGKSVEGSEFLRRIDVDQEALDRNIKMSAHLTIAEPLYIALQIAGYQGDSHKLINEKAVAISQSTGKNLLNAVEDLSANDEGLQEALKRIPQEVVTLLYTPQLYVGDAAERALQVADEADQYVKQVMRPVPVSY